MEQSGILGTGASLGSDLSLLAYLLLIVPSMLVGFVFARRKMFIPHHKLTMTAITIANWIIIFLLMLISYREGVMPYLNNALGDPRVAIPTIHLVTGGVAQLLATYLVLRMWLERVLLRWIMVRNIKTYMRFTLALWLITSALGVIIYVTWYARPEQVNAVSPSPVTTPEVGGTPEILPIATEDTAADVIIQPQQTEILRPVITQEVRPLETVEVDDEAEDEIESDDSGDVDTDDSGDIDTDDDSGGNRGMGMGN